MPWFWISRVAQGLLNLENMRRFWICLHMIRWTVLNMTGFWIFLTNVSQGFEYASSSKYASARNNMARSWICEDHTVCWIWQNKPEYALRIHWRLPKISKKATEVHEVMFFDMEKYIYSKCLFNTLDIEVKYKC